MDDIAFAAAATAIVALPVTPLNDAVIVAVPGPTAVASAAGLIVATVVLALIQLAAVEPSLYVAVAANCCVAPTVIAGALGVTAIAVSVFAGAMTVTAAVPLTPPTAAVTLLDPAATAVASPVELMVATAVVELLQLAADVMFAVDPSL
jgi:hypothetical protein